MACDSRLSSSLEDAEALLGQGKYHAAEKAALAAIERLEHLEQHEHDSTTCADRAVAVLLQSLYETNRFSSARGRLLDVFGSLEATPATSLLLWLSLALDTTDRRSAEALLLRLLQSKGPRLNGWTRRQYLTLMHLYTVEVLLPVLRDPSEVCLWLNRQPFLPLDPRERTFLEIEVKSAAAMKAASKDHSHANDNSVSTMGSASAIGGAHISTARQASIPGKAPPVVPCFDQDDATSCLSTGDITNDQSSIAGANLGLSPWRIEGTASYGRTLSPSPTPRTHRGVITDTTSSQKKKEDIEAIEELDWLGRVQQMAFDYAEGAYSGAAAVWNGSSSRLHDVHKNTATSSITRQGALKATGEASTSSLSSSMRKADKGIATNVDNTALAATAVAIIVAAAAYAERDSLYKGVSRIGHGVVRSLNDLLVMGLGGI